MWGIWNQITERDAAALLRTSSITRFLGGFIQGDSEWFPHLPIAPEGSNVYASKFSNTTHSVFLIVNRNGPYASDSGERYTEFLGANCYDRHGATDLESPEGSSAGSMDLDSCQALCDSTDGCTAVVHDADTGDCFRRADVDLSACNTNQDYDL